MNNNRYIHLILVTAIIGLMISGFVCNSIYAEDAIHSEIKGTLRSNKDLTGAYNLLLLSDIVQPPPEITSTRWTDCLNGDDEGYCSARTLNIDVALSSGEVDVTGKLYWRSEHYPEWHMDFEQSGTINSCGGTFEFQQIAFSGTYEHLLADFKFELIWSTNGIVATRDPSNDASLSQVRFKP